MILVGCVLLLVIGVVVFTVIFMLGAYTDVGGDE